MYLPYNCVKILRTPVYLQPVSLLQIFNTITVHASQSQLHTGFRTLNEKQWTVLLRENFALQAWAGP
jgi:hypothetical protein